MNSVNNRAISWTEQGLVPDSVIRHGIRRLLRHRLQELPTQCCEQRATAELDFIKQMDSAEIAPAPAQANEQHYDVPAEFFKGILGSYMKYSCCYWPEGVATLDDAEQAALHATCEGAEIEDGMSILDLGCGWGSFTLWTASRFPNSAVTAVSNSKSQVEFIMAAAQRLGLKNIEVISCDMNGFETQQRFDRVVSIEMFEHMRNHRRLFAKIHQWLRPEGRFFMHIFCHRNSPYEFRDQGPSDWMSRYFFTGGIMPSDALPLYFQDHLKLRRHWRWNGQHYERTLNAWLERMDDHKDEGMSVLRKVYGPREVEIWWMRWRIFFMACAELFGFDRGQQWWVSHYLFQRPIKA
jgi:cyclopropane-fatty-acyl-phospholipid synthase